MTSMGGAEHQGASTAKSIYVTLAGLPLSFHLEWPFRKSTAGADFWFMHVRPYVVIRRKVKQNTPELKPPAST